MRRDKEGGGEFLKTWWDQISIWKLPDAGSSFYEKDRTTAKVDTYKGIIEHRDIQRILQRPRTFLGNNWEPPQLSFSFIRANLIFWWRCQFGKPTHYITVVARPSFKFLDILWFDFSFIFSSAFYFVSLQHFISFLFSIFISFHFSILFRFSSAFWFIFSSAFYFLSLQHFDLPLQNLCRRTS